ncbi:MAG: MFS transporter, partial [Acidimicrobiales bacterium]
FHKVSRLRWTSVIMNLGIFRAVAAGPLVGEAEASFGAWRPLFWIVAAIATAAFVLVVLTFEDAPAADRSAPFDLPAIGLAAVGCVAAFFGASELASGPFDQAATLGPLLGGLVLIVALLVYQYRGKRVLLGVRSLATTLPVAGIVVAVCAAAASVSAIVVELHLMAGRFAPLHLGLLYLPELGAAVITAAIFGAVFNRRLLHALPFFGMACLCAGTAAMALVSPSATLALAGSGLVGLGVGAAVAPALFVAGWSLPSAALQRVFAIVELLRAGAAFMVAPILLHVATGSGGAGTSGSTIALWATFGLAACGAIVGAGLYALGGVRPAAPAVETWFGGKEPGWDSPPLLARLRPPPSGPVDRVTVERAAPMDPQSASVTQREPELDLPEGALSGAGAVGRRRPDDGDAA